MALIFRRQERALVMVEPPGQFRVARILEVDDRVLVAIEKLVFEDLRGAVGHPGVGEAGIRVKGAPDEAAEERGRGGAVETVVVIEDSYEHAQFYKEVKT